MKISIVVAVGPGGVIGHKGTLPWRIPEDLKHFRKITTGHHILMGRKTLESIGRPLPDRTNLILTRDKGFRAKGCFVFHSIKNAINFAAKNKEKELMVIGGEQIYKLMLPSTNTIYMTRILKKFRGDSFFPKLTPGQWQENNKEEHKKEKIPFEYITLRRRA